LAKAVEVELVQPKCSAAVIVAAGAQAVATAPDGAEMPSNGHNTCGPVV
jgi:hypothetical protein